MPLRPPTLRVGPTPGTWTKSLGYRHSNRTHGVACLPLVVSASVNDLVLQHSESLGQPYQHRSVELAAVLVQVLREKVTRQSVLNVTTSPRRLRRIHP